MSQHRMWTMHSAVRPLVAVELCCVRQSYNAHLLVRMYLKLWMMKWLHDSTWMDISRTILVVTVYDVFIIKTCLFCDQPDKYTHARTHKMVTVTVLKDAGTVQIVPCYHLTLRAWGLHSVECNDAGCPDGGPSKRFYVPRLMQLRSCTCRSLAQDVMT